MAIVNAPKIKQKKHGKKKFVRVSNKKAVKNGRAQPKPKVKITKKPSVTKVEQDIEREFVPDETDEFFGDLDESGVDLGDAEGLDVGDTY